MILNSGKWWIANVHVNGFLGGSSGDMMISVFWYYRPEQTEVGKIPGYNGDVRFS